MLVSLVTDIWHKKLQWICTEKPHMDVERNRELLELHCQLFACILCLFVYIWADSPPSGPSHSRGFYITRDDAPQSVELLWTSDQLVTETSA